MSTQTHYETVLKAVDEPYAVLPLQHGATALVTQRGARVLGIFPAPGSDNLLWTNSNAFDDAARWANFVAQGNWNLGGERIWIAPEIQYNVRNRADFWGTLSVPSAMDPGQYTLEQNPDCIHLHSQMRLNAYNLAKGQQDLDINRWISPISDPLSSVTTHDTAVTYCGYQQQVRLRTHDTDIPTEAWNLVQVQAGGQLIIPCMPQIKASDYTGSVPAAAREVLLGDVPHVRLHLDGKRQYKLGYQAASVTGRMAYFQSLGNGRAALLVRSFFNNPSNHYAEEPPDAIGQGGHSIHVYNDGGEFGGDMSFGEMECTGTTIHTGAALADNTANDSFLMWVYCGPLETLRSIAHLLLGVHL